MCGILGAYHLHHSASTFNYKPFLKSLNHRGPDSQGSFQAEGCWLGHTRLSIIAMNSEGHQPMSLKSDNESVYTITFNGEIYNYIELQDDLKKAGHSFKSNSDTEVALKAFAEWGNDCFSKFNGIWAMAIYCHKDKSLTLSRDRFGVKPMYIYLDQGSLFVASEVKSFLCLPKKFCLNLSKEIITFLGSKRPIYKSIGNSGLHEFPPGHSLKIYPNGKTTTSKWWDIRPYLHINDARSYEEEIEIYRDLFYDSLKLRLRSDAKTCTALSGGIDSSSVISAIYHQHLSNKNLSAHKAFVLNFGDSPKGDDYYAKLVLDRYKIPSTFIDYSSDSEDTNIDDIDNCIYHSEDHNALMIGPYLTYKRMSQEGFKVSIDGHGADELLCGYPQFLQPSVSDTLWPTRKEDEFNELRKVWENFGIKIKSADKLLKPAKIHWLEAKKAGMQSSLLRKKYLEFHRDTLPWILRTYDKIPMANGIEVRSPFLDWRLITFSFSLPNRSTLGNGFTKRILRDSMKHCLPESISNRTSKVGFGSPMKQILKQKQLKEFTLDISKSSNFLNSSHFDGSKVSSEIESSYMHNNTSKVAELWPKIQLTRMQELLNERSQVISER